MADAENGTQRSTSQLIITVGLTTLGAAGAVVAAFWSLADPRSDIANIRTNYLTLREHAAFEVRVARDIARLEDENKRQLPVDSFSSWKKEHDRVTAEIQRAVDDRLTKSAAEEVWRQRRAELDELHKQIDALRAEITQHERDDRSSFATQKGNGNGR